MLKNSTIVIRGVFCRSNPLIFEDCFAEKRSQWHFFSNLLKMLIVEQQEAVKIFLPNIFLSLPLKKLVTLEKMSALPLITGKL